MATVDVIWRGQSNVTFTSNRGTVSGKDAVSGVLQWTYHAGSGAPYKRCPWRAHNTLLQTFAVSSNRQAFAASDSAIARLVALGHSPRLIKQGVNASSLASAWVSGTNLSSVFNADIALAFAARRYPGAPSRRVLVWEQGETDATVNAAAAAYEANLGTMVSALRTALSDATLHVIVVQLSSSCTPGGDNAVTTVRNAQSSYVTAQSPNATLIDASGYALGDGLHRTSAAADSLGTALGDAIAALL